MARKLKIKIDKNEKKYIDELFNFYLNSLDNLTKKQLNAKMLNKIYKEIEVHSKKKFKYLAFDSLIVSISKLDEYLKEDVAFHEEVGFEKYLKLSMELIKEMTYDFKAEVFNKDILDIMSVNFFEWAIKKETKVQCLATDLSENHLYEVVNLKYFIKKFLNKKQNDKVLSKEKMMLVTLKNNENNHFKYFEIRKIDYLFLQKINTILKAMNLILNIGILETESKFVEKYRECIYTLQRVVDYIYFKEILTMSYEIIPDYIVNALKKEKYEDSLPILD